MSWAGSQALCGRHQRFAARLLPAAPARPAPRRQSAGPVAPPDSTAVFPAGARWLIAGPAAARDMTTGAGDRPGESPLRHDSDFELHRRGLPCEDIGEGGS